MSASIMKLVVGALIPTVFLCNTDSNKRIKKTENIHEGHVLAIVHAHNSKRHYVR